jgi:hypothetical protein
LDETLDFVELYKDGLFPVLEWGFEHRLSSGFRYHLDVDRGRCEFLVSLGEGKVRLREEHVSRHVDFDLEGDGFSLGERAAAGVSPEEIRALRRNPEDSSTTVSVPLSYLMAEEIMRNWKAHGPDRLPENMPGEWFIKYGHRMSEHLIDAMKKFELVGEVGVDRKSGDIGVLLRQNLKVALELDGTIHLSGTDIDAPSGCQVLSEFRRNHAGVLGFHIHEDFEPALRKAAPMMLSRLLTASNADLDALKSSREPEVIFGKTPKGFPARVYALEGGSIREQGILLHKDAGNISLVRNYDLIRFTDEP